MNSDIIASMYFVAGVIWAYNAASFAWPITIICGMIAILCFAFGMGFAFGRTKRE